MNAAVSRHRGRLTVHSAVLPPNAGIKGNSPMLKMRMMMDKNNLQLADLLLKWIDENAGK